MNRIVLDYKVTNYLMKWTIEHKEERDFALENNILFFDKVELIFENAPFSCIFEKKKYGILYRIMQNKFSELNKTMAKGTIQYKSFGEEKILVSEILGGMIENEDNYNSTCKVAEFFVNAYLWVNLFFFRGNLIEKSDRKYIAQKQDGIFVFRKYQDKLYIVPKSSHASPNGVFSVRGHFRRYQNGNVVWIDEYLKGTD